MFFLDRRISGGSRIFGFYRDFCVVFFYRSDVGGKVDFGGLGFFFFKGGRVYIGFGFRVLSLSVVCL